MEAAIQESIRVSRRVVVVNFYLLPVERGSRRTRRDPGNFLETHWAVADIETPVRALGWRIGARTQIIGSGGGVEEVWTLIPATAATVQDAECEPTGLLQMALPEPAKVSIVMPTYRRPHTIFRTVDTILAQTYRNWELIIVDNAGDADYHFDDPRIRVYRHTEQASASYARNQGLQYVNGDLVCFFDDDDDMFPTYLERFVMAFEAHPQAKMVHCGMIVSQGQINFSYATPECCLRRPFATPTWSNNSFCHDQDYFTEIVRANRWSQQKGEIVLVHEALCRANTDPRGGLRSGNL